MSASPVIVSHAEPFDWVEGQPRFRGLPVVLHRVMVTGRMVEIAALKDAAALLDDPEYGQRFIDQDFAPYGMELWPSAIMLANHVVATDSPGSGTAIELGCGMGLASIALALAGWNITATDHDEMSLRFAQHNADRNGAAVRAFERLDWRLPPAHMAFDRVFAADVLYQRVDHAILLGCIDQLLARGGLVTIADPNRGVADRFPEAAERAGYCVATHLTEATIPGDRPSSGRIYEMRRRN